MGQAMMCQWSRVYTGSIPKKAEVSILGFRKLLPNRFSHDIILPGCGTVRLGGSRTPAKGMFPDVMFSNGTALKGRRGQACARESPE